MYSYIGDMQWVNASSATSLTLIRAFGNYDKMVHAEINGLLFVWLTLCSMGMEARAVSDWKIDR